MTAENGDVWINGERFQEVPISELVPGDVFTVGPYEHFPLHEVVRIDSDHPNVVVKVEAACDRFWNFKKITGGERAPVWRREAARADKHQEV